ncbi:hypothetical protein COEREDRAFT_86421 [Coemansia reversa NRRL 1564]|uniref:Uncharacterized protein n=1 Tax=Coemansia reversa (strain ATCC 12441 / NRRL 1564) TaxID=763665 RepID=A0A2G5BDC7_COERN|nr:hypothetical protein COEREDRAFT_86418 [Coemansia reversa NRRL 1564]PIA17015.1 hypothetical protein COEREDRAFT_86421 [Coemansia reversa NRRL 1564]|eukprot:PIA17011.1 hypothetical protein COEREDRAFT_86418 [Coemansia reversa NRRL 1564]
MASIVLPSFFLLSSLVLPLLVYSKFSFQIIYTQISKAIRARTPRLSLTMVSAPKDFLQILAWTSFVIQVNYFFINSGVFNMIYKSVAAVIGYITSLAFVFVFALSVYILFDIAFVLTRKRRRNQIPDSLRSIRARFRRLNPPVSPTQQLKLITNRWTTNAPKYRGPWKIGEDHANGTTSGNNLFTKYEPNTFTSFAEIVAMFRGSYYNAENAIKPLQDANLPTVAERLRRHFIFFSKWSLPTFYYNCGRVVADENDDYDVAYRMLSELYAQATE